MLFQLGQPFDLAGTLARQNPRRAFDANPFPAVSYRGIAIGNAANGMPPQHAATPDVVLINGVPTVAGAPLATGADSAYSLAFNRPGGTQNNVTGAVATQVYDGSAFGDASVILITFAAPGGIMALARPAMMRTMLLIVNDTVIGQIRYNWDKMADGVGSVPIGAGGNRNFTPSVPQGNLFIFSPGAGNVIIEYMNRDIRQ